MADLQTLIHRNEVGQIKPWTKSTAPTGYLLCNGAAVSRTTYADLFAVISTTYGSGDGSATFNVPQLQGKLPQGYDGNTYNMAGTGGANTVTVSVTDNKAATSTVTNNQSVTVTGNIANTSLTTAQLASHSHSFQRGTEASHPTAMDNSTRISGPSRGDSTLTTNTSGDGTGHNHTHTLTGTLTGTVAVSTNLTGTVTASGTNAFSPYVVINYVIKY
jgi:microcystin-dependent protein